MKIMFIYVAEPHNEPSVYLKSKMTAGDVYIPKAGILYLIASLRREFPNFKYKAIDIFNPAHRTMADDELEQGILRTMSEGELRDEVSGFAPDIVGLSCLSSNAIFLPKIIKIIKEIKSDTLCILGGPFATSSPREAILTENIDFIVCGEGEITTCKLVKKIVEGGDFQEIRGIGFKHNNAVTLTPPAPFVENPDTLPFPAWDLCNLENYSKVHCFLGNCVQHSDKTNYANIVSSRGCPYRCIYCHKIFGSRFRARSAQNVVDEMIYLHDKFNVEEFTFSDDIFNLHRHRVKEFCKLLPEANRNIKFGFLTNGLRGDILTKPLIDLLSKAGMKSASIAVESGSPRIQKKIGKNLNIEKTRENINYMCKKGIYINTFNMIGFPTETSKEIKQTLEFNVNLPHNALMVFAVTPHEGTRLYNLAVKEGFVPQNNNMVNYWEPGRIDDSFREVSSSFLQLMLVKFMTEFYFTKKRLNINLDIMNQNRNNPFFISSIRRIYNNFWNFYSRAIPQSRKVEIHGLLSKILNF